MLFECSGTRPAHYGPCIRMNAGKHPLTQTNTHTRIHTRTHKLNTNSTQRTYLANQNLMSEPHRTGPTTQSAVIVVTALTRKSTDSTANSTQRSCLANQNVIFEPHLTGPTTQSSVIVVTVHPHKATNSTQRTAHSDHVSRIRTWFQDPTELGPQRNPP